MHTNFYLTAHPLSSRNDIDETNTQLVRLLNIKYPLSYSKYYSLIMLGRKSNSSRYGLEREIAYSLRHGNINPAIRYRDEIHGATTQDGRQAYVFVVESLDGVELSEGECLKEISFSKIASSRIAIESVVPDLSEVHFGLTFWGLYYPERRKAKRSLAYARGIFGKKWFASSFQNGRYRCRKNCGTIWRRTTIIF